MQCIDCESSITSNFSLHRHQSSIPAASSLNVMSVTSSVLQSPVGEITNEVIEFLQYCIRRLAPSSPLDANRMTLQ